MAQRRAPSRTGVKQNIKSNIHAERVRHEHSAAFRPTTKKMHGAEGLGISRLPDPEAEKARKKKE